MAPSNPKPLPAGSKQFGRPTKLNRALIDKIAATVRIGTYLDTAARVHGISKATYHLWMQKGHEQKKGLYRDFLDALEQAAAEADQRDHALIAQAAMKGDWKAAETHLKLRNPGRYTVRRNEHTGADGAPIQVQDSVGASLLAMFTKLAGDGGDEE